MARNLSVLIFAARWFCLLPVACLAADSFSTAPIAPATSKVWLVEDARATDAFRPRRENVQEMVRRGIMAVTGKETATEGWLSLVSTQDIIGLKVYSKPGENSGTRPAVVAGVAQELIAAGVPPRQIIIWDREAEDLREAGFFDLGEELGVRVAAASRAGWDPTNYYETPLIGNLVFGDLEFEKKDETVGRKSFVSKLVSQEMTKIINITPLLNHYSAGVCGNLYSLTMGSVDNVHRFEGDPGRLAQAVPELYALPILGDRVVLNLTDALVCQYEGGQRGLLHYSAVLNQLRFSRDPVALDVLSIKELDRQRRLAKASPVRANLELYRNASLLELGVSDLARMQIETLR
ncbi:MAG TPA: DUF362 domain-containing protein [Verrucomicrobiae bacterium]|nr:DUF362 domain-containing protein [Verrucomicrobiae bacterium]